MIKAVIFDMDGLLIDSEPLWKKSEIEVFARYGLALDEALCRLTMGMRIDEAIGYWVEKRPELNLPTDELQEQVLSRVEELIFEKGQLLPGVEDTISYLTESNYPLAIGTSSMYRVVEVVLDRFDLRSYFQVIHSAEEEVKGKPDPAVYLSAARKLSVEAGDCLVFEDAPHGVLAAKRAGMTCVAVPEVGSELSDFDAADLIIPSLQDLDREIFKKF